MINIIIFLPLLSAIIIGLTSSSISHKAAYIISSTALIICALLSFVVFYNIVIQANTEIISLARWLDVGSFIANWQIRVDSLTAVMFLLVTSVSALVHVYSVGYMSHDPHAPRFMSYLSLFTFAMLMLVSADNFLQLFFGWEGVGLCSYLLIGFWYKKDSARKAALKAFIVNRVGDFGLILGIFTIYKVFGSLSFDVVFEQASLYANSSINLPLINIYVNVISLICILLFIGAMGKSAQLGFHTWLPDAMEGPTPVSALIHAATMVTAGVFLVARCSPLFEFSETARNMVIYVGGLTAIFAASVAITQNDIKKIIAYSTCSQLGYMFFACGVSAYAAGMFHLLTHGFFKALLFLCAGSVIHALSDEQDIRNMGGIYKKIPLTYGLMLIGTIAIVGFPPFSGYFSKDMIIEATYAAASNGSSASLFAFIMAISAALLTSFYSWRLIFKVFHGKNNSSEEVYSHIHESPKIMTIPLIILAIGAIFAGGILTYLGIIDADMRFWNYAIYMKEGFNVLEAAHHVPFIIKILPLIAGLTGLVLAYIFYIRNTVLPQVFATKFSLLYKFLYNKWYFDQIYNVVFVLGANFIGKVLYKYIDVKLIDNCGPKGMAKLASNGAKMTSKIQNGLVYSYAFVMLAGLIIFIAYYLI